jgi:methylase of polypeptide subunit release factors
VRRALDLGTGCGVLALTMARHAERVVATDLNPRALALARRSARLNRVDNVVWRRGDWNAPVRGERFDLIACNPPYVVSPDHRLLFRDGAEATPGVVRGAGAHLAPGGLAHLLVNWPHPPDDWVGPLRDWIPPGCDALVVHHASLRPRQYAETWARPADVGRWLAWYQERGVGAIGAAFVLLRRRADEGPARLQALEAASAPTPNAGVHVERILRGTDLAASGDDALGALRLRLAPGVRLEGTALRAVPTVGVQAAVPPGHRALVAALDGSRPLGALAAGDGRALALARRLLELGLAEPAAG